VAPEFDQKVAGIERRERRFGGVWEHPSSIRVACRTRTSRRFSWWSWRGAGWPGSTAGSNSSGGVFRCSQGGNEERKEAARGRGDGRVRVFGRVSVARKRGEERGPGEQVRSGRAARSRSLRARVEEADKMRSVPLRCVGWAELGPEKERWATRWRKGSRPEKRERGGRPG
jgi:hypothetical protein